MPQQREPLRSLFTQNRTEEIGLDVYQRFVVPPFFDQLDLEQARKPRIIEGGRGCGKTMLLRYLAHTSTFSQNRDVVPPDSLGHIGLYWRADVQFARQLRGRGHSPEVWAAAFEHLIALVMGLEALASLRSIAVSRCEALQPEDLARLDFGVLGGFEPDLVGSYNSLVAALQLRLQKLEMWVSNAERLPAPVFLPGQRFLRALIGAIRAQLTGFDRALFFVYIDEYENLLTEQQRIINTYMKLSEPPLIINVAVKRNGMATRETTGDESLVNIADYREHDLEDYLERDVDGFEVFAAEVLLLGFASGGYEVPISVPVLRDRHALPSRRDETYRTTVLAFARRMLPDVSEEELGRRALADRAVRKMLKERIAQALRDRGSVLDPESFIRPSHPRASVTTYALLNRQRNTPEEVLSELDRLERGEDNRFTGTADWLHNNFVGALLALYQPYQKVSLFYAGFDTFCVLARANLRHFLELCHRALMRVADSGEAESRLEARVVVPPETQADAARETATSLLAEVRSFGRFGNRLHTFVHRLGTLFALAHARPTQSEPEICHFAIVRGDRALEESDEQFLTEAIKWSVLFEEQETKAKDPQARSGPDYVLNPVYAPYFTISYRKRRKLDLRSDDFSTLVSGTLDEWRALIRRYTKDWAVRPEETNPSLFAHVDAEGVR